MDQSQSYSERAWKAVRRRREGGFAARSTVPFGYELKNGLVIPSPENWAAARKLLELLIDSEINVFRTARSLPSNFPWRASRSGLRYWLINPILRGGIGRGFNSGGLYDYVDWNYCPALITPDEWRLILLIMERRPKRSNFGGDGKPHLFSGLLRCESCGSHLRWHTRKGSNGRPVAARYACTHSPCSWRGRGLAELLVRRRVIESLASKAAARMAKLAADGSQPPEVGCPELLTYEAQLEALERLREQGVTALGVPIARLRDKAVTLQPFPADALPAAYGGLFGDPETLLAGSDDLLRPVFLHFVLKVVYQGAPDQFRIKLR